MPITPIRVLGDDRPESRRPATPSAGNGPEPRMSVRFSTRWTSVSAMPSRSGVRASPAARSAPPSMKKSSMPMLPVNMIRR